METATSSRSPSPSTYRPLVIFAARLAPAVALGLGPVIASTLLGAAALVLTSSAASAAMERMSVASDGSQAASFSTASSISSDGRYVAFASVANNLVAGDANGLSDIFVHDRSTGSTTRVSVAPGGVDANGASQTPSISGDGRYVAYASRARNIVAGKLTTSFDVFVYDRVSGTTVRASTGMGGVDGTGDSFQPWLSSDGRYVAFASLAPNLVAGDTNATFDVFVRDLVSGAIARISTATDGTQGNGLSVSPRLSADGTLAVFHSFASNLVAGDTNAVADVFMHDMGSGATERVSVASNGAQGNQQSIASTISGDGRFVAFASDASNLVSGDGNGRTDVFVRDLATGVTERASVSASGLDGDGQSGFADPPSFTYDGRHVAFTSAATNLVASDTNVVADVFVRDRALGETRRVSVAADGTQANGPATLWASLSANGRAAAFASSASNLVPNDTNGAQDVFVSSVDCGNGVVNPGEECDDGNVADGDCCSAECNFEAVGSACSDGDLCTQTDGCDGAGSCVGADPVVCPGPGDSCRANGACDPTTGTCPILDAPAGTPCSDGNLCTGSDACDGAGSCVGSDPVVCAEPSEACHVNGACDPATGTCPILDAPDGTPCDDGEACTTSDACAAGACEPGELDPSACVDPTRCYRAELGLSDLLRFRVRQVTIADEFGSRRYLLQRPTEMCATATVDDGDAATPPGDGAAMRQLLACHDIEAVGSSWQPPAFERRLATVDNDFGEQQLAIGEPREMCLRAKERGGPASSLLDDYACYAAKRAPGEPELPERTVQLEDRFGTASVRVGKPELFCNPAAAEGASIAQPLAHLVCYATHDTAHSDGPTPFRPIALSIEDQFTSGKLFTYFANRLCMPTAVLEVTSEAKALKKGPPRH